MLRMMEARVAVRERSDKCGTRESSTDPAVLGSSHGNRGKVVICNVQGWAEHESRCARESSQLIHPGELMPR